MALCPSKVTRHWMVIPLVNTNSYISLDIPSIGRFFNIETNSHIPTNTFRRKHCVTWLRQMLQNIISVLFQVDLFLVKCCFPHTLFKCIYYKTKKEGLNSLKEVILNVFRYSVLRISLLLILSALAIFASSWTYPTASLMQGTKILSFNLRLISFLNLNFESDYKCWRFLGI